jgi:hypothetical protein
MIKSGDGEENVEREGKRIGHCWYYPDVNSSMLGTYS